MSQKLPAAHCIAPAENPFRASCVRPGAIPLFLPPRISLAALAAGLQAQYQAQILGPHGSGKSTLFRHLVTHIRSRGPVVAQHHLGGRPSAAAWPLLRAQSARSEGLLAVDGFEQLTRRQRRTLQRLRRGRGLLVTAHDSVGLPTLWEMSVSVSRAQDIVNYLLSKSPHVVIRPQLRAELCATVESRLRRLRGNLREVFFEMYDLCGRQSPASTDSSYRSWPHRYQQYDRATSG